MSQAEIAGGVITLPGEIPSKDRCLYGFELTSTLGRRIQLSDYRGCSNLVLICMDHRGETIQLLLDVARQYPEIKDEEAEVLAIVRSPDQSAESKQQLQLPYPLLVDEDGRVHRELGAIDLHGHDAAAVYVIDRFGKVFGAYRTGDGEPLPRVVDILKWLAFINIQCPECEAPEWPA